MHCQIKECAKKVHDVLVWFFGFYSTEDWDILYGKIGIPPLFIILTFVLGSSITILILINILRILGVKI